MANFATLSRMSPSSPVSWSFSDVQDCFMQKRGEFQCLRQRCSKVTSQLGSKLHTVGNHAPESYGSQIHRNGYLWGSRWLPASGFHIRHLNLRIEALAGRSLKLILKELPISARIDDGPIEFQNAFARFILWLMHACLISYVVPHMMALFFCRKWLSQNECGVCLGSTLVLKMDVKMLQNMQMDMSNLVFPFSERVWGLDRQNAYACSLFFSWLPLTSMSCRVQCNFSQCRPPRLDVPTLVTSFAQIIYNAIPSANSTAQHMSFWF